MQAITTRYHGPTDTKGSRYSATSCGGARIYSSCDNALNSDENHARACGLLMRKLGWDGEMVGGGLRDGSGEMCWVFADHRSPIAKPAALDA